MIDKQSLMKRFSASALEYDQYAMVQKKMAKRVVKEAIKGGEKRENLNILEIGCGTGYLTGILLDKLESPNIVALDIAPGMIAESKKKFEKSGIEFRCEDIETAKLEEKYDLIVSNATFQWLNDLESTVAKLIGCLREGGKIVFSTFGEGTFKELYDSFEKASLESGVSSESRLGQTFYSLTELKQVLEESARATDTDCGIEVYEEMEYERFKSAKEFLCSIKKIGANNSNRGLRLKRPKVIKRMIELYDENYRERDGIKASYKCFYTVLTR
jgi:malonyl-CoA O-methyltransferase